MVTHGGIPGQWEFEGSQESLGHEPSDATQEPYAEVLRFGEQDAIEILRGLDYNVNPIGRRQGTKAKDTAMIGAILVRAMAGRERTSPVQPAEALSRLKDAC